MTPPVVLRERTKSKRRFTVFGVIAPDILGVDYVSATTPDSAKLVVAECRGNGYTVSCVLSGYAKPVYCGNKIALTPQGSSQPPLVDSLEDVDPLG